MTNLENALMEAYKEDLLSNDEIYSMLSILHEGTADLSDDQKKFLYDNYNKIIADKIKSTADNMKQLYKSYNREIKGYASDPSWNSDAEMLPKNPKKEAIAINAIKSDLNHFKSDLIAEMNKFKNDNAGTNPILYGISINTGLFGNKTKLTGGTDYKLSHIPFDGTGRYVSIPINSWINTVESFSQDYDQIFWEYDRKYASESYFKSIDSIRKSFKCEELLKQAWMLPLTMK